VNIAIGKGETVAFVGPSGSGKSTLVKLLVGLYKPTAGRLVLNGIDSSRIDYEEFRTRVGYVSQETQLFAGTIRENLLFVNPQASDEDCIRMLKAASALPIIERGGHGLDTKIGEGGIKISGGERQRLAIARALLRHPEILIFDEATSSLDSITEKAITETIREVSNIRSDLITVLVAHRLSTVSHADKIYVLAKGRITEEGSHQNLLRAENLYAALWREQSAQRAA
jgi:ATP-binding cassette subfamily B protein